MNKKKWTSLFLAFVMVLGIMPFNVFAKGEAEGTETKLTVTIDVPSVDKEEIKNGTDVTFTVEVTGASEGNKVSWEIGGNSAEATDIKGEKSTKDYKVDFENAETKSVKVEASIGNVKNSKEFKFTRVYGLDVTNGSSDQGNEVKKDTKVTVNAASISGKKFKNWEVTGIELTDDQLKQETLTFDMPANDVTLEAKYDKDTTEPTEDKIKIKNIYIYKDAVVVDVDTKDAKVYLKDGSKEYNQKASRKENSTTYRAVHWKDYYDKDDRENVKVYATKSGFKDSETKYLDKSADVTVRNRYYDKDDDDKDDDLKRVYPKDLKRTDSGRRTEGTLKDYKDEKVYVYYKDDEIGSGWTDKDGFFDIKLDAKYTSSEHDDFKYYVDEDANKSKDDLKQVYPKDVELYGKRDGEYRDVKGTLKDYSNEKIYVYLKGNEKGSGTTDKNGKFDFRLDKYIDDKYDEDDLKFYVKDSKSSSKPFVTRALADETKVEGKDAGKDATVEIKDSNGTKLGSTTADKDGKFTVTLNRALRGGETITVVAKESGKNEVKVDYIVPGISVGGQTSSKGYINGYEDGSFKPNANMTRAEATTMMARLMNGSDNFNTSEFTKFYDANNQWYSKAVGYAVGKGVINGYPDGSFQPNNQITRAEFVQMLSKYINKGGNKAANFNDIKGHWAEAAIVKIYNNNIIDGYPDGSFKPDSNITRAEAVKMLNIAFQVKSGSYTNSFYDVKSSDWFYNDVMKAAN